MPVISFLFHALHANFAAMDKSRASAIDLGTCSFPLPVWPTASLARCQFGPLPVWPIASSDPLYRQLQSIAMVEPSQEVAGALVQACCDCPRHDHSLSGETH